MRHEHRARKAMEWVITFWPHISAICSDRNYLKNYEKSRQATFSKEGNT